MWVGLGWVQKFWVGLGFEKVTHDQLYSAPPLRGALYKKWGGHDKNFFPALRAGYVPHHFHIRSGALERVQLEQQRVQLEENATRRTEVAT